MNDNLFLYNYFILNASVHVQMYITQEIKNNFHTHLLRTELSNLYIYIKALYY